MKWRFFSVVTAGLMMTVFGAVGRVWMRTGESSFFPGARRITEAQMTVNGHPLRLALYSAGPDGVNLRSDRLRRALKLEGAEKYAVIRIPWLQSPLLAVVRPDPGRPPGRTETETALAELPLMAGAAEGVRIVNYGSRTALRVIHMGGDPDAAEAFYHQRLTGQGWRAAGSERLNRAGAAARIYQRGKLVCALTVRYSKGSLVVALLMKEFADGV